MTTKGYDYFLANPNDKDEMYCLVCTSECNVERNGKIPINFGEVISKSVKEHDVFTCPNTDKGWHQQAIKLLQAIENTPSKTIAQVMRGDLEDLLKENLIKI